MQKDAIVIGSGPAGYMAAIYIAKTGMDVLCVDSGPLGGTCLNVGCIPSKSFIKDSKECAFLAKSGLMFDFKKMSINKTNIIKKLSNGIVSQFKQHKIDHINGKAKIINANEVLVTKKNGEKQKCQTNKIVIATGSKCNEISGIKIDRKNIITSDHIFDITDKPKTICIIGGGYIGIEMGIVFSNLGSDVTIVESGSTILPHMDPDIRSFMHDHLQGKGVKIKLNSKIKKAIVKKDKKIEIEINSKTETTEKLMIAIGRQPNTDDLFDTSIQIGMNKNGFIDIDQKMETSIKNIYAIGDVTGGMMLAHKAEQEALELSKILSTEHSKNHIIKNAIPAIVYTNPEIATVGKTEDELQAENTEYEIKKADLKINPMAHIEESTKGFIKILYEKSTKKILGVHIVSKSASEIIWGFSLAISFGACINDLSHICYPHPSIAEIIKNAAND